MAVDWINRQHTKMGWCVKRSPPRTEVEAFIAKELCLVNGDISSPSQMDVRASDLNKWGLVGTTMKSPSLVNGRLATIENATTFERQISSPLRTEVWLNAWFLDNAVLKSPPLASSELVIIVNASIKMLKSSLQSEIQIFSCKMIRQYAIWLEASAISSMNVELNVIELMIPPTATPSTALY